MTVQNGFSIIRYDGTGSLAGFATAFEYIAAADVTVVIRNKTSGLVSSRTGGGTHYDMDSPHTAGTVGTVTFTSGNEPEKDETIVILRNVSITQATNYVENEAFNATLHEDGLDKLTMIAQQISEDISRIPKVPVWSTDSPPAAGAVNRVERIFVAKLDSAADGSGTYLWSQQVPDTGAATWDENATDGKDEEDYGRAREFEGCTTTASGTIVTMYIIEDSNSDLTARFAVPGTC